MHGNFIRYSIIIDTARKFVKAKPEFFVFFVSTLFYYLLWYFNPENKIIVISFFILFSVFYLRVRDFRLSLFLSYLVSSVIYTGKMYNFQLIPAGVFPKELFPDGYILLFIISTRHILSFLMAVVLIRDLVSSGFKMFRLSLQDIILVGYYLWILISDLLVSGNLEISLLFSTLSLEALIVYFYLRALTLKRVRLTRLLFWVFISMVVFQVGISFQQFAYSSPISKNIGYPVRISYFGMAPDELQFRFRPIGTFPHANMLATWLSYSLSIIFVFFYKKINYLFYTLFIFVLTVLLMTLSRGAWVGSFISVMFILYIMEKVKRKNISGIIKKHIISLLILGVVLLVLFVAPRTISSIYSFTEGVGGGPFRLSQIIETVDIIKKYPIFGVGTAMSLQKGIEINPHGIYAQAPLQVHNWYFLQTVEHGIPSVVLFLLFVILSFRKLANIILESKMVTFNDYARLGFFTGCISIFIVGFFQPFLFMIPIYVTACLFQNNNKQ